MRILHLDSAPTFRGGQRQLALLAIAQRRDPTLAVRVLARAPELLARLTAEGVDAVRWSGPGPTGLLQLGRHLRRFAPALVHAHDARCHGLLRPSRLPLVVHRRIDDPPRRRALTRWKYGRGRMICVSEAVGDALRAFGLPEERLHVVRSAVPVPDAPPPRAAPARPLRLAAVGALVAHKGHGVLLDALSRTRSQPRLQLLGDGPLAEELRRRIARLGLRERVELPGYRAPRWSEIDLLVHPSITEGLGTAVLEAMAAACPVLASDAGGLPEAVVDGQTGWLVPAGDPGALADALDRIADRPAELTARGRAGWLRVSGRPGIDAMVAATRAVYDRALDGE